MAVIAESEQAAIFDGSTGSLIGTTSTTGAASLMFTLPSGHRPAEQTIRANMTNSSASQLARRVTVKNTGTVEL